MIYQNYAKNTEPAILPLLIKLLVLQLKNQSHISDF